MGYGTWFELEIRDAEIQPMVEAAIRDFRADSEEAAYALDDEGMGANEATWYDWDQDLRAISAKWPNLLFVLSGVGEDSEDRWKCYARAGKMQLCVAELIYPEFEESQLA